MKPLSADSTLLEVAVAVSEALERAGIVAPLSGGAAVAIYTNNRYLTRDLDFVTSARAKALTAVLEPLGFTASPDGRHFAHEPSGWLVEFPPGQSRSATRSWETSTSQCWKPTAARFESSRLPNH